MREPYIQNISTRSVDDLFNMGMIGISKRQVSRLCEEIDEHVKTFFDRPIKSDRPYVWPDVTYLKVRQAYGTVLVAVIIVVGVNGDGWCEVLGLSISAGGRNVLNGLPA